MFFSKKPDSQPPASNTNAEVVPEAPSIPTQTYAEIIESNPDRNVPAEQMYSPSERLSLVPSWRLFFGASSAGMIGFALGASQGGLMAGYRFRAENAHRLPTSQKGWFFYHKTKNYHVALGGIKEGLRMGAKLAFWASTFLIAETAVDDLRGPTRKDALSSVVAAAGTSGAWSVWNRFPIHTWARTTKVGLLAGFGYGAVQDILGMFRGRTPGYVELLFRNG